MSIRTDDDDVGGAGCPSGYVGSTARVDADVARLGAVDDQRTLAGLRVERRDVPPGNQHQLHLPEIRQASNCNSWWRGTVVERQKATADYCWVYGVIHFTSPAG